MSAPVLAVTDLDVDFLTHDGTVHAVNGVSFDLFPGETLGIVGESGSGKSVSLLSVLGLVPMPPGRIVGGSALFDGEDLLTASDRRLRALRGNQIAVVFQDPDTALNPVFTIGNQLIEAIRVNDRTATRRAARARAVELLDLVGISEPAARLRQYPFEFSGGMRQRVMIAIAIANQPRVLIADEPTTALDVTVQAQIFDVLMLAQQETGAATVLITHDLGVIAEMADRVVVMYAGKVVETAAVNELFERPLHPYTEGLLASRPSLAGQTDALFQIAGSPPFMLGGMPPGCAFAPRCHRSRDRAACVTDVPPLGSVGEGERQRAGGRGSVGEGAPSTAHGVACHFWSEAYQEVTR